MGEAQIYFGVLLAGLVSFLSPCVLPLVVPYLSFLGGTSIELVVGAEQAGGAARLNIGDDSAARWRIFSAALAFVAGFTTVFVVLGASASLIGQVTAAWGWWFAKAGAVVIILFGLHFLGLFKIALFHREARYHVQDRPTSLAGAYVVGLAFAFGWTPCLGPILAAVLVLASNSDSLGRGVALLFTYAMGLGIPFLAATIGIGTFLGFMKRFRRHLGTVEKVMGAALVVAGVLMLTGSLNWFGAWLLDNYPGLANIETWVVPASLRGQILAHGQNG